MGKISSRIRPLREFLGYGRRTFAKKIEIPEERLRNIERGTIRAGDDILDPIAENWPEYAYWLMTGKTDEEHGHISPDIERLRRDSTGEGKAIA